MWTHIRHREGYYLTLLKFFVNGWHVSRDSHIYEYFKVRWWAAGDGWQNRRGGDLIISKNDRLRWSETGVILILKSCHWSVKGLISTETVVIWIFEILGVAQAWTILKVWWSSITGVIIDIGRRDLDYFKVRHWCVVGLEE